jgi:DNA-binding NarL/FixJ family response regulator
MILKDEYLQTKGIPFVFVSTNANAEIVRQAQLLSVQGFFKKPGSFTDIKTLVRKLFDYWELCQHINNT